MNVNELKITQDEYIAGLQSGNEYYFSRLVSEYRKYVLNICYKFLFNREDAEDTAQEVFTEIYLSVGSFRKEASLATWIYRIAVRKSLDLIRKKKRKKRIDSLKSLVNLADVPDIADINSRLPDEELNNRQTLELLQKSIDSLPETQRTAFVLSKMEDMSVREIAQVMKTTESSVIALIHRAKKRLQSDMEKKLK